MWKRRILCLMLVLCAALLTACQQEQTEVYPDEKPVPTFTPEPQGSSQEPEEATEVDSSGSQKIDFDSDDYNPESEEDGETEEIFISETPATTPAPTMTSEYAGATPVVIDPIDKPTATPLPKLTFTYAKYEAAALHLQFEGPAGWIVDDSEPDSYTLIDPTTSMDYPARITVRAVPVNKDYNKNELTKEVKGALETLRSDTGFSKFDPSNTASRDFIDKKQKGVYIAYKGTLKENDVKVAGRIMVNCVNKTLYYLYCSYPGGLADTYADVYNKARSTMKLTN